MRCVKKRTFIHISISSFPDDVGRHKVNGQGYREEDRREDNCQEDNFPEGDPRGLRNKRLQRLEGQEEDA